MRFLLFFSITIFLIVLFSAPLYHGESVFEMIRADLSFESTETPTGPEKQNKAPLNNEKNGTSFGGTSTQNKSDEGDAMDGEDDREKATTTNKGSNGDKGDREQQVKSEYDSFPDSSGAENEATVTARGILEWTNYYREKNGLESLVMKPRLVAAAKLKVEDMFQNEYFLHVSPSGKGVADWAGQVGYEYLLIGENLALGDFFSSKDIVDAWMDSPHHRENILRENYTQIGIAAGFGEYEGNKVWLAVQEFGRPRSACPAPDDSLKNEIASEKDQINRMMSQLQKIRKEIKQAKNEDAEEYNDKVEHYNELVSEYKPTIESLQKKLDELIPKYNSQVEGFNQCVNS